MSTVSTKFKELQDRNRQLAFEIDRAMEKDDSDLQIKLKKELYSNKLKMLGIVEEDDISKNLSASQLIKEVEARPPAIRYETGIANLDRELNGGFEVGSLILVAGVSTAGKTHTLLDILSNVSTYSKCLFFNFEMGDRRIVNRLNRLLKTKTQRDNFLINNVSRKLDDLVMEIIIAAKEGMKFFAIDSRMKIIVEGNEPEYMKISHVTKRLSEVAIHNDIIVILINQISEEDIKNKRLSFKGSGDQMYDADMALFITIEKDGIRKLRCAKNRQDERLFAINLPQVEIPTVYQDKTGRYQGE